MAYSQQQLAVDVELELRRRSEENRYTVVGVVCPDKGLIRSLSNESGSWDVTDEEPVVYIGAKAERALTSNKRFVILVGGRGSMKSVFAADHGLIAAKDYGIKSMCLREFQSSIEDSIQNLLAEECERLEFDGFDKTQRHITYNGQDAFKFAGIARNVNSVKSASGFGRFHVEEAQFLSKESIEVLTPTARNKPNKGLPKTPDELAELAENKLANVQMIFTANIGSVEDPFSQRFIVPFQDALDRDGFYEDDLHLIVVMNYHDNPWFLESGLEQERLWAKKNLTTAMYDHIWGFAYNDSVENSLIIAEWFDACIDAHTKLGFEPLGAKIASHDPSDLGSDPRSFVLRHGSVVTHVELMRTGDVNEGCRWACDLAIQNQADYFTWDADGMGCVLGESISKYFKGKTTKLVAFKGSESPDNPESIHSPALGAPIANQVKVKDAVKNKRAQYYDDLRGRVYRTYRAVIHGEYYDPDTLISFSSDITELSKLRAELCRMPIKPNGAGLLELYTKDVMRTKFKFTSPNCGDGTMMNMRFIEPQTTTAVLPRPIRVMGKR
jgi:phage terminase large subunit